MSTHSTRTPAATVVVPVYGRLDLLQRVLAGFVDEARRTDFELVLVDDGSDPPAASVLSAVGAPASFRCIRHEQNRGRGAALNTGVEHATAEVLIFCDADIVPTPCFVDEHLAFHREQPSELATHLGALDWGVDVGLYGRLLGARSNPRLREHRGAVDWTTWFTDNWSCKRRLLVERGLRFDPFFRRWGWEELELARRLAAIGATSEITGRARGLHLKEAKLEDALRSFARSVPNLLHLARVARGDAQVGSWLAHRCASEGTLAAAETSLRAMWQRCQELDTLAADRGGLERTDPLLAKELARVLSNAVFHVGVARGFRTEITAADLAGLELPSASDLDFALELTWLATTLERASARIDDEETSGVSMRTQLAALCEGCGLRDEALRDFWQQTRARAENAAMALPNAREPRARDVSAPEISVLVPTYGRPDRIRALLSRLDAQTLAPERFEVVVVDDGTPEPIALDAGAHAFALTLLRQTNAGPGAARNHGLTRCRAPLTLILNDDAVPAPDLLEKHLEVHANVGGPIAVLGTFHFTAASRRQPFVQVLEDSNLLFDFPGLRDGEVHDWRFFWTCNLSLPTAELRAAGGFDAERFREAIVEDCELGYRMAWRGIEVLYRADLQCEHDHALDSASYFKRMRRLGVNLARMYAKHRDPAVLWCPPDQSFERQYLRSMHATCEAFHRPCEDLLAKLQEFERDYMGRAVPKQTLERLRGLIKRVGLVPTYRGVFDELDRHDIVPVLESGPKPGRLTSVIVVSHQALAQTQRCLEALRRSRDDRHPIELLFVDNGSTDGTPEWLARQSDVQLIRNASNLGAPRARNQALAHARGEFVAFLDNDVQVTPGWLARLLYHAEVDARSGCISCVADRAGHEQQIEFNGATDPEALATFADRVARNQRRQFRSVALLSSFVLLARRAVIDAIGGFDERFSPWGFEDDDYSLRAHLAGLRNRIALDVFVRHEPYDGPKLAKHTELLRRNWLRFATKWGMPASTKYGDYGGLAPLEGLAWSREQLHLPFREQAPIGNHLLAWPDYTDARAIERLLAEIAPLLDNDEQRQLVLRIDPKLDGPADTLVASIEAAFQAVCGDERQLSISLLDEPDVDRALEQALVLCSELSSTGSANERAAWLSRTGLAPVERSAACNA